MKKRQLTPEQTAARDARRDKFRELARRVSKMTEDERQAVIARMPAIVTIEGRALSAVNSILIGFQNPRATIVGGFRQWIKHGRAVKKGEHGAVIWVPGGAGKAAEGSAAPAAPAGEAPADGGDGVRFLTGTVFDVTQTAEIEADHPVATVSPEIADAFGMRDLPNVRVEEAEEDASAPAPAPRPHQYSLGV